MPRLLPMSHTAPTYPGEPSLAWTPRLDDYMYVDRFDVLYPAGYLSKARPLGVDFTGILKVDLEGFDERAQRARCLEAFEQILAVLAEAGMRHREHPAFEIGGRVERGAAYVKHGASFLDDVQIAPDHLIPQCTAKFQVWLEGA